MGTLAPSFFGTAEARVRHAKQAPKHPVARRHPPHAVARHSPARHHAPTQSAAARPVILIDPGHGGTDPGAISRHGIMEKSVTLATALRLARALTATGRYHVVLTRHDDHFVPLSDRAALGRASDAALIVSLHADWSPDPHARGASVYVRRAGLGGGMTHVGAGARPAAIASALGAPPPHTASSDWLQYSMIDSLNDDVLMTAAPARAARLRVLATHGIPGVLVEMGFLSNARDEKLLRNPRHQQLIARCLKDAVNDYFRLLGHRPPQHT